VINVFIVDDHELIREGLKKVLARESDIKVVGEARNSQALFEQMARISPDVIILDMTLPDKNGIDILKQMAVTHAEARVLVLSIHPEDRFAVRALRAGAAGYLTKNAETHDIVAAIRKIAGGGSYISPPLADQLAEHVVEHRSNPLHENLSDREYQVLLQLADGKKVTQIAENLNLSVNTVGTYRSRILEKMHMKSNSELTRYVLEHHLMD
jgi:DNA-binding NarL/FixJ family response regulator